MPQTSSVRIQHGGQNKDVTIASGANVGSLLREQGLAADQLDVLVNGQLADINRALTPGDTLLIVEKTQTTPGGTLGVRVGRFPGKPVDMNVAPGTTVRQVLEQAGLPTSGFDIRRNGQPVDLNEAVAEGDQVALFRPVQGNDDPSDDDIEVQIAITLASDAVAV